MSGHDTERIRISQSMDDLMIRTIGLMETLPDRISKLETALSQLEQKFAKHEGEQEQGIKRTVDRVEQLEKVIEELKKSFDECKKNKAPDDLAKEIKKLDDAIKKVEKSIEPLIEEHDAIEETRKTFRQYIKEAVTSFIRYATLPLTIIILVVFGMDPSYIPWYKPEKPPVVVPSKGVGIEEFWKRVYFDKIDETDIYYMINHHAHIIIRSGNSNREEAQKEYEHNVARNNLARESHIFIWLPRDGKEGIAQVFERRGRASSGPVKIVRGY